LLSTSASERVRLSPMTTWLSLLRILRPSLSISLVLWVAGAGCLLGCGKLSMTGSDEGTLGSQMATDVAATADSCALRRDHNCCAKHHASSPRPGISQTRRVVSRPSTVAGLTSVALLAAPEEITGCPLAINATALSTKARADESAAAIPSAPFALPSVDRSELRASSPAVTTLNDGGRTYLRCCVFLI
jgi:hypothetical protein